MGEIANRDNKKMLILFAEVVAALGDDSDRRFSDEDSGGAGVCDRFDRGGDCCLSADVPVWVHAVVAAVQLVAGVLCGRARILACCVFWSMCLRY